MVLDGIEYRTATKEDLEGIIEVWKESEEYHSALDPRLRMKSNAAEHVKRFYGEKFFNDRSTIFVAIIEGKIVGYASVFLQKRPPIHFEEFWGFIDAIVVTSKCRRHGIGTKLFGFVREWLTGKGVVTMRLTVATKNAQAISFWKKMGFSGIMYIMDCKID